MLRRTGALSVQIRYHDDEKPTVWIAVAEFSMIDGVPAPSGGEPYFEAAAAMDPTRAALRLCEQMVDGSECKHCHRPAGLEPDSIESMPLNQAICWYQWDPELQTFRRGCE
jgi:hypothetical protein